MAGLFFWILCISLNWKFNDGGLPSKMTVGAEQSLFLFWRPTQKSLTGCNVTTPSENIDMFTESHPNFVSSETLKFENGYCCVTVMLVNSNDSGTWHLWATEGENNYHAVTNVTVIPPITVLNRTVSVLEGTSYTVKCGNENAIYCRIKSPNGVLKTYIGNCAYSIIMSVTVFDHEGTWTCSFAMDTFVREFTATTELKVIEDNTKEMVLLDLPNEYAFYCKMPKDVQLAKMCRITTPYGLDLYLTPGKVYGRYTYYGLKASHCGVTIPKPLAQKDIGPWKCQLIYSVSGGTTSADVYGGYMTIGTEKKLKKIEVPAKKMFWTEDLNDHTLLCHVPYAIQYCWFRSPQGTVYTVKDGYIQSDKVVITQGFKFGDCALLFRDAKIPIQNSTGKWTCNIGLIKESVTEMSETMEILYSDIPMIPKDMEVSGKVGTSVELGCRTGQGKGIKYCRMIRPDGKGLSVDPIKNNSDYSYSGQGFIFGYCGITIHSLKAHDMGNWSCAAKIANDFSNKEYTTHIILKEVKGSLIVVYVLIGIGGLFSLFGISYVIVRKFEFKVNYRRDDDNTILVENDGNEEGQEEAPTQSRIERVNDIVRFVRKRSPRPPTRIPDSSYI